MRIPFFLCSACLPAFSFFHLLTTTGWHIIHLLHPQRHFLEERNSSNWKYSQYFCLHALKSSKRSFSLHCFFFLVPSASPLPPPFSPTLCSVLEPLYRRGVLGRASKAFITGFAVLYYTGKHRATHAWPLTSLWSSAIHEKRGLWPTNIFPI